MLVLSATVADTALHQTITVVFSGPVTPTGFVAGSLTDTDQALSNSGAPTVVDAVTLLFPFNTASPGDMSPGDNFTLSSGPSNVVIPQSGFLS